MNAVRLVLVGALWLGLTALIGAQDKKADKEEADVKKKIVGRWEATKGKGLPAGAIVEFKKDGKLTVTAKQKDEEVTIEGTYKVKEKTLTLTTKRNDKERTQTIKVTKISDKEL